MIRGCAVTRGDSSATPVSCGSAYGARNGTRFQSRAAQPPSARRLLDEDRRRSRSRPPRSPPSGRTCRRRRRGCAGCWPRSGCRPAPSSSSARRSPCARSRRPSPAAPRRARRPRRRPRARLRAGWRAPWRPSGKWKASVLARREQAAIITWVTASFSMSSRIVCTPASLHRKSCSRTSASCLPCCAIFAICAGVEPLADAAARADVGGGLHVAHVSPAGRNHALGACARGLTLRCRAWWTTWIARSAAAVALCTERLTSSGLAAAAGAELAAVRRALDEAARIARRRRPAACTPLALRFHADRQHDQVVRGRHSGDSPRCRRRAGSGCRSRRPARCAPTLDLTNVTVGIALHLLVEILEAVDRADVDVVDRRLRPSSP